MRDKSKTLFDGYLQFSPLRKIGIFQMLMGGAILYAPDTGIAGHISGQFGDPAVTLLAGLMLLGGGLLFTNSAPHTDAFMVLPLYFYLGMGALHILEAPRISLTGLVVILALVEYVLWSIAHD